MKNRTNLTKAGIFSLGIFILCLNLLPKSWADKSKQVLQDGGVTCSSSTVTTQIMGYEPIRTGYCLINSTNQDAYVVKNSTGGSPSGAFTSTNAVLYKSGYSFCDSGSMAYVGFVFCQSTGTNTVILGVEDFGQ